MWMRFENTVYFDFVSLFFLRLTAVCFRWQLQHKHKRLKQQKKKTFTCIFLTDSVTHTQTVCIELSTVKLPLISVHMGVSMLVVWTVVRVFHTDWHGMKWILQLLYFIFVFSTELFFDTFICDVCYISPIYYFSFFFG